MKLVIFSLLIAFAGLTGCSSNSSASRKPVTNIQITPANKVVVYGNEFSIDVTSKITKPKIVELEVYFNNQLISKTKNDQFSLNLSTDTILPGKYSIKTIAKNSDGKTGINYNSISIVSDIEPKQLSYKLIGTLPHNTANYTEGFEFYNDNLIEGTGNYKESFIYEYNPVNQKIIKSLKNDDQYFGEGITVLNDKLYQLTYKARKGFIYDVKTFKKTGEFNFSSEEGWGLTNDGKSLIMSNGSSTVIFINPNNFAVEKTIEVNTPKGFVSNINELEYVDGAIYANIWTTQTIVKFDAETGRVLALIDLTGLMDRFNNQRIDVLNGIAYNPKDKLFYVTGKWWPTIFKVSFE